MLISFHDTEFMQAHDVGDQTKPHGVINYPIAQRFFSSSAMSA